MAMNYANVSHMNGLVNSTATGSVVPMGMSNTMKLPNASNVLPLNMHSNMTNVNNTMANTNINTNTGVLTNNNANVVNKSNKGASGVSDQSLLWQWDIHSIRTWLNSILTLNPKRPTTTASTAAATANESMEIFLKAQTETNQFKQNLITSLHAASATPNDTFNILDPSFSRGKDQVHTPGAILSRLAFNGMINGIHGKVGGVFDDPAGNTQPPPPSSIGTTTHSKTSNAPPSPQQDITPTEYKFARTLLRAIGARVEMDMLNSTPARIIEMLCPEMTITDVEGIRKRIYQTVVMGKGTHSSAAAAALEGEEDVPVAAKVAQHDIDKFKKCNTCGNNDQAAFVMDRKNGDLICTGCGTVATESLLHEGSAFRKFEGEADRNHHGDVANPLYSNAHNMGTTLSGIAMQSGAGIGWGSKKQGLEKILRHTHTITEMSLSQFGKEEKKTRVGYKDKQKKDAFVKMAHVADALSLHEAVLQQAKILFAGFRDDRELVQQFQGVLAACLWESFDQLSKDGRQILKGRAGEKDAQEDINGARGGPGGSAAAAGNRGTGITNDTFELETKRAGWRNDMHSASLASTKILDKHIDPTNGKSVTASLAPYHKKDAKLWNLDDCRTWLVEASKTIAKKWVEANENKTKGGSTTNMTFTSKSNNVSISANNDNIPKGTQDELEGQLVAHTLTLCDHLEKELTSKKKNISGRRPALRNGRAFTPRVSDMSKLGIRWQKPNERGSGGKGGVGNSGRSTNGTKPGEQNTRAAGQVLLLMTSKQFTNLFGDQVAGDAFHHELRTLLGRQEERKRKERGEEVARTRVKQLKRKPWLSARAGEG